MKHPKEKAHVKKENKSIRDRVGGAVEKVGHKLAKAGAPVLGQKVHDLGDALEEHHTNVVHPHRA